MYGLKICDGNSKRALEKLIQSNRKNNYHVIHKLNKYKKSYQVSERYMKS